MNNLCQLLLFTLLITTVLSNLSSIYYQLSLLSQYKKLPARKNVQGIAPKASKAACSLVLPPCRISHSLINKNARANATTS